VTNPNLNSTNLKYGSVHGWARDVSGRDRDVGLTSQDETETRRLQVSRRDRDVKMHVVINAVVNKLM